MWKEYNPNPKSARVGDCSIRALSKALNMSWDSAYILTATKGYEMKDMPSANAVWGAVLREYGFKRKSIPDRCPDCYTAADFCKEHSQGIYVLGFGNHVATEIDGTLFDAWDSSLESPQYYFYKED